MLKTVGFAVKLQLNVHDLNNETIAGNVNDIRMIQFLDEKGRVREEPGVSGRMIKHWHYEAMRRVILSSGEKGEKIILCDACRAGEPMRGYALNKEDKKWKPIGSVNEVINGCSICDVHGYLVADKNSGTSERRISRALFSWLLPVLDVESSSKQVVHNRVSSWPDFMMPYNKSYASGIYGFLSVLDVDRIGVVETKLGTGENGLIIDEEEKKSRTIMAIEAYRSLISGHLGASLSHAIPHTKPIEVLAVYSEEGPLPFPVSPIYQDFIMITVGIMPKYAKILYWGGSEVPDSIIKKNTIDEIFDEIISKV